MSQENTVEENFQLKEAEIITIINHIKNNKELISRDGDRLFQTISSGFSSLRKSVNIKKNLYGKNLKFVIEIYNDIFSKLDAILKNDLEIIGYSMENPLQEDHYFEFTVWDVLSNIEYEVKENISNYDFDLLWDELSTKFLNFEENFSKNDYLDANITDKKNLAKIMLKLRNDLLERTSGDVKIKDLNKNTNLETLKAFSELKKLKFQLQEIKDSHEMLSKIKENVAIENTYELQNGYQDEVLNTSRKINKLNVIIVSLFSVITLLITLKIIFIIFQKDLFKDLYNFLTYLSLLLSLSALIIYFIKERNRLIKLHDYFNLTVLELKTLPQYMRELDSAQRKNLIINLSSSFFKGSNKFLPTNEQEQNISNTDISNIVSNTIKFINEQKK
ncbi:hypothetical protein [Acinetobacter sp. IK40]|jgi:hypothetical protein|uniref:hypothetical protein n=1 Tax=Acinetobacter sp. IK40 TaxID=2928897 RepID=UPI002D1F388B|nr:hypothetical protein [Acinetobacter sp. IK40]MEB3790451.1 hypothetical protein [Acinetobacter sp. IK40]